MFIKEINPFQRLPLFQKISNKLDSSQLNLGKMSIVESSTKYRQRKKVEVPVHTLKSNLNNKAEHKIYSAQFNGKRRSKLKEEYTTENPNLDLAGIERYSHRNEEYFKRKIVHLKGKLDALKSFNDEVIQENSQIKTEYKELLVQYEEIRDDLENSKYCQTCEDLNAALEKSINENNNLITLNTQLTQDVNMLKNVVYRLNVQLERYQEKLRKFKLSTKGPSVNPVGDNMELVTSEAISTLPESHLDHPHTPISWGSVNSHTLGPLLDAYQETISEKEEIIQNYEVELSHFTGRLQSVIEENEKLHKRLVEDDDCSAKLIIELDKVNHNLKSAKSENDLLIKKCALKQDKLQEVLQCYEHKVDELRRDYSVVVEQYHKSRNEIAALKEKNKALIDSHDEIKNERQNYIPLSMHNSSVNECKKWYEELKHQYEQEKTKMKDNIETLTNQINNFKTDKEELDNKLKQSEKTLKKMETKYLDLQHSLHEVQLSRSECRKQLHKAMNFAKDLVTEQETLLQALHQRQQENKAVKQIGSDIATRMDSLKSQLKTVQRDAWQELSTVEQRLQDQDTIIIEMKREHNQEVERLKEIIRQKDQSNLLLNDTTMISSTQLPHYVLLKDKNML